MRLQEILLVLALVFSQGALNSAFANTPDDSPAAEKTSVPTEESSSQSVSLSEKEQRNAELIEAIERKDVATVQKLLNKGADPDAKEMKNYLRPALMVAIRAESPKVIDVLLEAGAQVNYVQDVFGFSVLQAAIRKGNPEILAQVLKAGAGKDTSNEAVVYHVVLFSSLNPETLQILSSKRNLKNFKNGEEILIKAIKKKSPKAVEWLLKIGVSFRPIAEKVLLEAVKAGNVKTMELILDRMVLTHETDNKYEKFKFNIKPFAKMKVYGGTALIHAVELGNIEPVQLLLERGASVSDGGESLRDYAVRREDRSEIVKMLDEQNERLIKAIEKKDVAAVQKLLKEGVNPNAIEMKSYARTALMVAIGAESPEIIRLLVKAAAQVNYVEDAFGFSVLQAAIRKGNPEILAQVLEAGAGKDTSNKAVVYHVVLFGSLNPKSLQMLISKRNLKNFKDGEEILIKAIKKKNPRAVEWLLKIGVSFKSIAEKVLLETVKAGNVKTMELILDRMVLTHETNNKSKKFKFNIKPFAKMKVYGGTALIHAVELGNAEAVKLLLDRGASVSDSGESLRDYAVRRGDRSEIVKILDGKSSASSSSCYVAFKGSK